MPIGTPFHQRTFPLCESLNYREWSGYYTVSAYETHHEHEYNRSHAAALIDISRFSNIESLAETRPAWSIGSSPAILAGSQLARWFTPPGATSWAK